MVIPLIRISHSYRLR